MRYALLMIIISNLCNSIFGADFSRSEIALAHELKKTPLAIGGSYYPLLTLVLAYLDPWRPVQNFENILSVFAYDGYTHYGREKPPSITTTFFNVIRKGEEIRWEPQPYLWYVKTFEQWLPQIYRAGYHGYLQHATPTPLVSECGKARLNLACAVNEGKKIFTFTVEQRPPWHEQGTQAYVALLNHKRCVVS